MSNWTYSKGCGFRVKGGEGVEFEAWRDDGEEKEGRRGKRGEDEELVKGAGGRIGGGSNPKIVCQKSFMDGAVRAAARIGLMVVRKVFF